MKTTSKQANTLFEAVRASLGHATRYNPGDVVAPAAMTAGPGNDDDS